MNNVERLGISASKTGLYVKKGGNDERAQP